ncbi:MAG: hypothetical protein LBS62_06705 [Clostridiales bacterium]|jgi:hypothetical protein|nr:hypothetical protein [Clostridiales bacterium]
MKINREMWVKNARADTLRPCKGKLGRIITVAAAALAFALMVGCALNGENKLDVSDWDLFDMPDENYGGIFFKTDREAYHTDFLIISAQLMNTTRGAVFISGNYYTLVKQDGDVWRVVPFDSSLGFDDIAHILPYGESQSYHITPDKLAARLDGGRYRIVAEVYGPKTGEALKHSVWTEFLIDKNAEKQEKAEDSLYLGRLDGRIMTLEDMREIVGRLPNVLLKDLQEYRGVNISSSRDSYNMLFTVESGSLQVYAGPDYIISKMTFKKKEASVALDLLAEPERLEDYLKNEYMPATSFGLNFPFRIYLEG